MTFKLNWSYLKLPEKSRFFNQHDGSLGRHRDAASRKSLEIQA